MFFFAWPFRYKKCEEFIKHYEEGKLQTQPGCTPEETVEVCTPLHLMGQSELYIFIG